MTQSWFKYHENTLVLTLYVQPGAKQNNIAGIHGEALKIRLTAPPLEGRANTALIKYLATLFNVAPSKITLKQGDKTRYKTVSIEGSQIHPESLITEISKD